MRLRITVSKMRRSASAVSSIVLGNAPIISAGRAQCAFPMRFSGDSLKFLAAALVESRCATRALARNNAGGKARQAVFRFG